MGLRFVAEKNPCQDENCLIAHVAGQRVCGVRLRESPSWRRDRPGTGPHPGWRSFPKKNGESEAASSTLTGAQYLATQLLITNHPVLLSNARAGIFVHRSFF